MCNRGILHNPVRYFALVYCGFLLGLQAEVPSGDLSQAHAALDRGDPAAAVSIAEQVLSRDADNVPAWIILGHGLSEEIDQAGILRKAALAKRCLAAYLKAVSLQPRNVEAHTSLVEFYRRAPTVVGGSRDKAYAEAKLLLGIDAGQGYSLLTSLQAEEGKFDEAFATCEDLQRLEPDTYRALFRLGETCAASERQLIRGLTAMKKAIVLTPGTDDPDLEDGFVVLGRLLEKSGARAAAVAAYERAIQLNPKLQEARERLKRLNP